MPVLGAIMMVAGFAAIRFAAMRSIWSVGGSARWAMIVTLLATLVLSILAAIGVGVVLTLMLFIDQAGRIIEVHELTVRDDGDIHVGGAPTRCPRVP